MFGKINALRRKYRKRRDMAKWKQVITHNFKDLEVRRN